MVEEFRRGGFFFLFGFWDGLPDFFLSFEDGVGGRFQRDHGEFALGNAQIIRGDKALNQELDVGQRPFFHQAEGGEFIELEFFYALVAGAFEHLGDKGQAKALLHAVDAGEDLLRINGDVDFFEACLAVAAIIAENLRTGIAEIVDDEMPQTFRRVAVVHHLLQGAEVMGLAFFVLDGYVNQVFLCHDILRGVEQNAAARFTVAARAACFLIVGFDVFGHIVVNHIAHI